MGARTDVAAVRQAIRRAASRLHHPSNARRIVGVQATLHDDEERTFIRLQLDDRAATDVIVLDRERGLWTPDPGKRGEIRVEAATAILGPDLATLKMLVPDLVPGEWTAVW